jgi:hypothetical protein
VGRYESHDVPGETAARARRERGDTTAGSDGDWGEGIEGLIAGHAIREARQRSDRVRLTNLCRR